MKKKIILNPKLNKILFIVTIPTFLFFYFCWQLRGFSFEFSTHYNEIIEILIVLFALFCLANNPKDDRKLTYIICAIHMSAAIMSMPGFITHCIDALLFSMSRYSFDERSMFAITLVYIVLIIVCTIVIYKTFNKNLTWLSLFIISSAGATWINISFVFIGAVIYIHVNSLSLILISLLFIGIVIATLIFASNLIAKGKKIGWYIFIIGASLGIWVETIDIRPLNIKETIVLLVIQAIIILISVANLIRAYRHGSEVLWQGRKKKEVQQSLE